MNIIRSFHIWGVVKNNRGAFLAEVLIASVIAGILMVSLISMLQLVNTNSSRVTLGLSKNQIASQIRFSALSLKGVESSALITKYLSTNGLTPNVGTANNLVNASALADCLPNVAGGSCTKENMIAGTPDELGYRFYLYNGTLMDPSAPESFSPSRLVAGEDVFYKTSGERCNQTEAATASICPLKAEAWAEPYCQNFTTTCSKAISLTIKYKVSLRSDFSGSGLMAPISGEVYLPLTKGIQLSRLLSETNAPIAINTFGIYSVQKYNYDFDQTGEPKGLRFEAILGNPTGLLSMRLQYRALTGAAAFGLLDNSVPAALTAIATWNDVPNHIVSLASAKSNQIINFGTQDSATTYGLNRYFKIGAYSSDTLEEQRKYRWHYDAGVLKPPTEFLSGFYQFRVLSTDTMGNEIESMNYITVRIVPRPQMLIPSGQPSNTQDRNCISGQGTVTYSRDFADDEGLSPQSLTLAGVDVSHTQATGRTGQALINFDISQSLPAGEGAHTYDYELTVPNPFSNRIVNAITLPASSANLSINLKEKAVGNPTLYSLPGPQVLKLLQTSSETKASLDVGSCCSEIPTASWNFPVVPDIGQVALSMQSPGSAVTCTLDTANNKKTCNKSITVKGEAETLSTTNDITYRFTFSNSSPNACNGGASGVNYKEASSFIKVVSLPGISFYLKESLWLNLPATTINGSQAVVPPIPKVYVRIDFPPEDPITVGVYRSIDLVNPLCSITFDAGTGTSPVDKECAIGSYSGQLILQRISTNIKIPAEPTLAIHKAKITDSQFTHTACQANISSIPSSSIPSGVPSYKFDNYTNSSNYEMDNTPWGSSENDPGERNDITHWSGGESKTFRCYDRWSGDFFGTDGNANYSFNNTNPTSSSTVGSISINNQDHYNVHRYNREEIKPNLSYPDLSQAITTAKFQTFFFRSALDINRPNIPWFFVVYHNGDPGPATFRHTPTPLIGGSNQSIDANSWTNFTSDICTGSSALSTIKLYGVRLKVLSGDGGDMKAVNEVFMGSTGFAQPLSYYSYRFMCAHGRWNPYTRNYTDWQH